MKIKIQIKSYFGTVLFEAEKEDYTVKQALQDADLQGADLQGAYLRGAYLRGADLRGAYLRGADLQDADLQGADLQGADLQGADLRGADLQGADLRGAYLRGADLRGAYLRGADLRGAYLRGADLQGADLQGAYLQGADLQGAYLRGAYLRGADLRGAKNIPQDYINICSRDMLFVFEHLKSELPFLRTALIEGKVNGTQYSGECACLIGTLAHARGVERESEINDKVCTSIPFYEMGLRNPGEQWFWQIRVGDTPEKSEFAAHAVKLIDMVLGKVVKRSKPNKSKHAKKAKK